MRLSGRNENDLRTVNVTTDFTKHAPGSVLFEMGNTRVLCTASIVAGVPRWLENSNQGWLTAEYSMLPTATHTRKQRETGGKISGRTQEIQRLIGRSLRAVCDLRKIPEKTVYIDCDVLQADGGTRCASITGACIALGIAAKKLIAQGKLPASPLIDEVAAISVGLHQGACFLDLDYEEDSKGDVDMNVVMTGDGRFVEVQGTAEGTPFTMDDQKQMIGLAAQGIKDLVLKQRAIVESYQV